jgi:fumarylpyruvate hydrolase
MNDFVFPPATAPGVAVSGSKLRFPVHRIYCVGRNYADHVREMGAEPERAPPIFFMKPADAVVANGTPVAYPSATANLHHEVELVVALGSGGRDIDARAALGHVFGYAVGNDLTRRDLQAAARERGQPWDTAKGFDASAPIGAIRPVAQGHVEHARIWLKVNDTLRQESDIDQMLLPVPGIMAELSRFYELRAGDLIFTGTPAGVGPLKPGDRVEGGIEGLETLRHTITAPSGR